jgi:hypothetical protein
MTTGWALWPCPSSSASGLVSPWAFWEVSGTPYLPCSVRRERNNVLTDSLVPWLYPTEINALAFRAKGASLAMASNWICNYMVAQITPPGIANLGYRFWIIWAVICASFVPITYLFYPETANRSLEDIDRYFYDNPEIFVFRNKLATQIERPEIYEEADRQIAAATMGAEKGLINGKRDSIEGIAHEHRV